LLPSIQIKPFDPLFLPFKNYRDEDDNIKHITGDWIYKIIIEAQKWLGHANIQTTRIYDHRERTQRNHLILKSTINGFKKTKNSNSLTILLAPVYQ